jgi:hypothetical protein
MSVAFFVASHLSGSTPTKGEIDKMSDIVLPELVNAVYEERLRDAEKSRRTSTPDKADASASVLRSLIHLFARA